MMRTTALILLIAQAALAEWQTVPFDLTKPDPQAYTTDIPPAAFTPDGLKLAVKPGVTFSLMSNRVFSGEFDFDLQIEVPERSEKGTIFIDMLLVNDEKQRKAVATYMNSSLRPSTDHGEFRYFKDGQPVHGTVEGRDTDRSSTTGYGEGTWEWLRLHKAETKVWFLL